MHIDPFELLEHKVEDDTLISLYNSKNYKIEEDVEIPSVIDGKKVTRIERIANLNHVTSLIIPATITRIAHRKIIRSVFLKCDSLQQLCVYDTLHQFSCCSPVKFLEQNEESGNTVFIRDRSKTIDDVIFNLLSHPLNSENSIKNTAFYKCPHFRKIIIRHAENSDGMIQPVLFKGLHELKEVEIQDGVRTIGDDAFAYCLNLEKIVIPPSVTAIRYDAFHFDTKLEIYGETGSYAQEYARIFGFPFYDMSKEKYIDEGNKAG